MKLLLLKTAFLCTCLSFVIGVQAQIRYVDASRPSSGAGTSWGAAYKTLAEALTAANSNAAIAEIRVAAGTYYPAGLQSGTNRDAAFTIYRGGLKLYGGYPAGGGTRNLAANTTILSGEINNTASTTDNSYHVLVIAGLDVTADSVVVDGFSVQWGRATGSGSFSYNGNSISRNDGGGIFAQDNANGHKTTIRNCIISANYASDAGAGMCNDGSATLIVNCLFSGNYADYGGAMINGASSHVSIINSTLAGNHDNHGGGGMRNSSSNPTITNTIIYHNDGGISNNSSTPEISYSLVQGLSATTNGNLNANNVFPNFINVVTAGTVNTTGNYTLSEASWCIDAGNALALPAGIEEDLVSNPRNIKCKVDMGAYEFQTFEVVAPPIQAFCTGATVSNLTPYGQQIKWYTSASGGAALNTNTALVTGNYYVSQTEFGCESRKTTVAVLINSKRFVKAGATGSGTSWADASGDLQSMINGACSNTEIWVAAGTYKPNRPARLLNNIDSGNRKNAFVLKADIKIFGGFPATGNPSMTERNWKTNSTVLSGDFGIQSNNSDNALHVVISIGDVGEAELNGFTVSGGEANVQGSEFIMGEYLSSEMGGGIATKASSPIIRNCIIKDNYGLNGGGMYNYFSSFPRMYNCTISGNSASRGGGIYNDYAAPEMTNCIISGNISALGGGLYNTNSSDAVMTNCTISGNKANYGGGLYNSIDSEENSASYPVLTNCIIFGNSDGIEGSNIANFSIVQGGANGNGNLDYSPMFINAPNANLAPFNNGDYHLQACSFAINAGDNASVHSSITTDIDGNPRIYNGARVDMGAYEAQGLQGPPAAPTVTAVQKFCGNNYTLANLVATGTNLKWYNQSGTVLPSSEPIANGYYYASQTIDGCESIRSQVLVTVNTIPAAPTATTPQVFCSSGTVTNLTATGTGIQWYAANSGGAALISTTALVNGTTYYASQTVSGCESAGRKAVTVSITITPAPTASTPQSFCGSGKVANLTAIGTAIQWYAASSGGAALVSTTSLVNGTTYYASQTVGGCESSTRTAVAVSVNPIPSPPAATTPQAFCGSGTVANLTATGTAIKWYAANSGGEALVSTTPLVAGLYYATQTTQGCESQRRVVDVINSSNTLFVKQGATGNGTSWANASGDLEAMLNLACPNTEIWVAAGTYKPRRYILDFNEIDPLWKDNSFLLKKDVKIYGGFPAVGNPSLADRNWALNVTTLSGDIGIVGNKTDNLYSVVTSLGNVGTAELNGFTITGGNAVGQGGVSLGIYTKERAQGGGIMCILSSPIITNCRIVSNTANEGGGIWTYYSDPVLTNCIFSGNVAVNGGGMFNISLEPILTNCLFSGNKASVGGGIYNLNSSPKLTNCSISGNAGGAIYNEFTYNAQTSLSLKNCIVWGNDTEIVYFNGYVSFYVNNNIIKGGHQGNNRTIDPLFLNAPSFTTAPFTGGDYSLQPCSPAINTGNNASVPTGITTDLAGNPRIYSSGIVDMGVFEYQANLPIGAQLLASNGDVATTTIQGATTIMADGSACRTVANIIPNGAHAIAGNIQASVGIDPTVLFHNNSPYVQRHYDINPANNAQNATAALTLYFTQAEFDAYNVVTNNSMLALPTSATDLDGKKRLRIFQYHGISTGGVGTPASYTGSRQEINPDEDKIVWNNNLQRWEITFNVEGFSGFFAGVAMLNILPVKLIRFTGQLLPNNTASQLLWQVVEQQGIKQYEVERNINGTGFKTIGAVAANNLVSYNYTFTDNTLPTNGQIQYRLKIVDNDGKDTYSDIISINIEAHNTIVLYPIPAKNEVWIKGNDALLIGTNVQLLDMQGRLLQMVQITAWPQRMNTSDLASGMYIIKTKTESLRLIIKR